MNLSRTVIVDSEPGDDWQTAMQLMIAQIQELNRWRSCRPKFSNEKRIPGYFNKPDKSDKQQQNQQVYHDEKRLFDGAPMEATDVVTLNLTFST